MNDIDNDIAEIEMKIRDLRRMFNNVKGNFIRSYRNSLETSISNLEIKLESVKKQLESVKKQLECCYANDIEIFQLQRENYFLRQGIGIEEMKKYLDTKTESK